MPFPPPTHRQARVLWFALTALAVAVLLALAGLLVWGLGQVLDRLSAILVPAMLALILAYILDPVVEYFTRKKLPRIWAILLVFLLGLLVAGGIVGSVVPGAIRESRNLIEDLPGNAATLRAKGEVFVEKSPLARLLPEAWRESARKFISAQTPVAPLAAANPADTNVPAMGAGTNGTALAQAGAEEGHGPGAAANVTGDGSSDLVVVALRHVAQWVPAQLGKVRSWVESSIGFVLLPVCLFFFLPREAPHPPELAGLPALPGIAVQGRGGVCAAGHQ